MSNHSCVGRILFEAVQSVKAARRPGAAPVAGARHTGRRGAPRESLKGGRPARFGR